ncbi:MAG: chloride channel protein [Eubacteriales bacterium]|nr:chloride channel protein [Eubacteriales bacterium]
MKARLFNIQPDTVTETFQRMRMAVFTLFKWLFCSVVSGVVIGLVGTGFYKLLAFVTELRINNFYFLFLLPVAGIIIVFMYRAVGEGNNKGTNIVITAIQSNDEVPIRVAPLIIISTLLTHLCGGSAGREGAALQVGGSVGNFFANHLDFDEKDKRIMVMCGMSACFAALFGTPIAAAIFSMEVISVGIMYYAALVPCVISAFIAQGIAAFFNISPTRFDIGEICSFNMVSGTKFIIMSALFALASILFCIILHTSSKLYSEYFANPYIRIVIAGLLVIALRYITGTTDYLGAGADIISKSFTVSAAWYVFLLKMIFTAITLGGGYKGGEIVPTLFVGATLGSFLAPIFGLPVGLCAGCGMVSVFCGVTNCPLTSLILSIEMFGAGSMKFVIICVALSYMLSGYYSLYNSQKIVYSKYKTEYINRRSH